MKKWLIIQTSVIIIAIIISGYYYNTFGNVGISNIQNIEDVCKLNISYIDTISNISLSKEIETSYMKDLESDSKLYHTERQILIVTPTDNIKQYSGSIAQDICVDKVIEGDQLAEGKNASLVALGGLNYYKDEKIITMSFLYGKNLMLPNNQYLIFCEKTEINDYLKGEIYRTIPSTFSWICLTNNNNKLKSMDEYNGELSYLECKDAEFFAADRTTLDALLAYKQSIINYYCPSF